MPGGLWARLCHTFLVVLSDVKNKKQTMYSRLINRSLKLHESNKVSQSVTADIRHTEDMSNVSIIVINCVQHYFRTLYQMTKNNNSTCNISNEIFLQVICASIMMTVNVMFNETCLLKA